MTGTFCPLIRETCKGNECVMYRDESCLLVGFLSFIRKVGEEPPRAEADWSPGETHVEKKVPDWLTSMTAEEVAAEMLDFVAKEFPDDERVSVAYASRLYLQSKDVSEYFLPADIQLKIQRSVILADNQKHMESQRLRKERLQREKEELPSLVSQCIDWARAHGLKRLTVADVETFILEKQIELTYETRRALYSMANLKLKSRL